MTTWQFRSPSWGTPLAGLGRIHQATACLDEALRVATDIGNHRQTLEELPAVALLIADLGQVERAVELYALASRFPRVGRSRWFSDVAGTPIDAIAAGLPPEVVAAALSAGRGFLTRPQPFSSC